MHTWCEHLGAKYSALPGVRKLHDFLIVRTHDDRVVMKVREKIYSGAWTDSPLRVVNPTLSGRVRTMKNEPLQINNLLQLYVETIYLTNNLQQF